MPSPGKAVPAPARGGASTGVVPSSSGSRIPPAAELIFQGRGKEREGRATEAIACFESAAAVAERAGEPRLLSEALRRLAIARHHQGEPALARALCVRSYEVARRTGNMGLAAEALNSLGGMDLMAGALDDARKALLQALQLGGPTRELRARVEQNLGIIADIQGEPDEAIRRYLRSLDAYRSTGDRHGCAIAYHNLGKVSARRELFSEAEQYLTDSRAIAQVTGDRHLEGLCLVNLAEVDVARQRYENAKQNAEQALALFTALGARGLKAEAYRVIGMVYRDTGRPALAESRFRAAIEDAVAAGSALSQAEAHRELALLYQKMGRNQEALRLLGVAYTLFWRLDARVELIHVGGKIAEVEATYLDVVRAWGQSLESSDSYTFGHCERVARRAVALARVLKLDTEQEVTVLIGAYLHDLGMMRVPHEILHKTGPLTQDELEVTRMHPVWGVELLDEVDFPWDIKSVIRSHHERYDGSGYPDRLEGDDIPLAAQIVGIVESFDAMTSPRHYREGLPRDVAVGELAACRSWWSPRVFEAFLMTLSMETQGHHPRRTR